MASERNEGLDSAPSVQVKFNQFIWVYEDPENDTFSSTSAVVRARKTNRQALQNKRTRSYSAPQDHSLEMQSFSNTPDNTWNNTSTIYTTSKREGAADDCNKTTGKMDIDYLVD